MAKDIFDYADDFIDALHDTINGKQAHSQDYEFNSAWEDLDSYLRENTGVKSGSFKDELDDFDTRMRKLGHIPKPDGREQGKAQGQSQYKTETRKRSSEDERILQLARDYRNLELEPGSDEAAVRSAYKKMLMKYHPDKFAGDQTKQATATEITIKLGESMQRILDYLATRKKA